MEVRVAAADGTRLPDGCVINVGVGEVQKQARYDPKKLYRFNEAKRTAKVDVYRLVGSCDVSWGLDQPEVHTFRCGDGDAGIQLSVNLTPVVPCKNTAGGGAGKAADNKAAVKGETSARARKYLKEQDVEGLLTNAMRALLQAMPQDSTRFLADYISTRGAGQKEAKQLPRGPQAVLPFVAYYKSNVAKEINPLAWAKMHSKFPRKPRPMALPFAASSSAPAAASEEAIRRLEAEVRELREGNRKLQELLGAQKPTGGVVPAALRTFSPGQAKPGRGDSRSVPRSHMAAIYAKFPRKHGPPPSPQPGRGDSRSVPRPHMERIHAKFPRKHGPPPSAKPGFGDNRSVPRSQMDAIYAKFPRKYGPSPASGSAKQDDSMEVWRSYKLHKFLRTPSVGTWLQARPPKPKPKQFSLMPSVGTWLAPVLATQQKQQAVSCTRTRSKVQEVEDIRRKVFVILGEASENGALQRTLEEIQANREASQGSQQAAASTSTERQILVRGQLQPWSRSPSVGTWLQVKPPRQPEKQSSKLVPIAIHQMYPSMKTVMPTLFRFI